ncbi:MAG: TIGR02678 family protein [Gemmatimonadota bacterium]
MIAPRIRTREPQRAYLDLLDRAAVSASDDDAAFRRIRATVDDVRTWYAHRTGWPTIVTRELIRTVKTPSVAHVGQGFEWASEPLDYELLSWILWYGESIASDQFVFSELVEEIELRTAELQGEGHFTWDRLEHRRSLKRAAEALADLGVIREVDGSVSDYAEARTEDALYEFTAVARHLHLSFGDELYEAVALRGDFAVLEEPVDDAASDEQRLYRSLLLSPALYAHHDPDAFAVLRGRGRRERIADDIREHFGWDLEVTRGYACLLRPARDARGRSTFPARSAETHVVLLLCGRVRELVAAGELVPDELDAIEVTRAWLEARIVELQDEFGAHWGRTMARLSLDALVDGVVGLMTGWCLMERSGRSDELRILPLAARWEAMYSDDDGLNDDSGEDDGVADA